MNNINEGREGEKEGARGSKIENEEERTDREIELERQRPGEIKIGKERSRKIPREIQAGKEN